MVEVSRMVDSGSLKAMLDIFADYFMNLLDHGQQPRPDDERTVLQVGNLVLEVLSSRACQQDFHLRLYIFRALSIVCKVHQAFRQEKTVELVEHLTRALDWTPAHDPSNSSLSAIQESALLYTGHLSVILLQQDPQGLLKPMERILALSAAKTITSEMPSCIKSFVLPIAYSIIAVKRDASA